ncbi:MAG: EcsC family protein [Alphaproteobacteria bacterium]|nr:EcsC family protein [Alphaproteobacteria bacterium]
MDPRLQELLAWLTGEEDPEVLRLIYDKVSVSVYEARGELKARGWPYAEPAAGVWPPLEQLDESADHLAKGALLTASAIGLAGALGGLVALPPELLADALHSLRMAQRMGVIYGFDPATDKGRILLRRAMEAAYGLPQPDPARPALRLVDLPALARQRLPQVSGDAARWAASTAARRVATWPLRRAARWVPGLGPGLAARASRRVTYHRAMDMKGVYRAAWEGPPQAEAGIEEAEIVSAPGAD